MIAKKQLFPPLEVHPTCRRLFTVLSLFTWAAVLSLASGLSQTHAAASNRVARSWNEQALTGIRMDTPHPPAQARNLFSLSVCMYDAWAAYDTRGAVGFAYRGKHTSADIAAARREAISYAAYRMLKERHAYSRTATNILPMDDTFMESLGYDLNNQSRDTSTPAGVGNSIYDAVSAWFIADGSRQTNGTAFPMANPPVAYPDALAGQGGYTPINPPISVSLPGINDGSNNSVVDINHWQRAMVPDSVDQNGFPQPSLQKFLGAQWLRVRPFALVGTDPTKPCIDPGPPPYLGGPTDATFKSNVVEVIRYSSQLSTADGVMVDISPASIGNNSVGANDGHGYATNPVTGQPYQPNSVLRGDFTRALTEFWADGPSSETPPGHWNSVANNVADDPLTEKRIGGTGPVVDDLEWDVKVYFALNAALHDAACAAWSIKRYYDGWRPLTAVRYLGGNGQSSDPSLPSYHTNGLPLVPDLIELVTDDTVGSGRHAGLTPGKIAVRSWPGQPEDPANETSGVTWVHAESWTTYQKRTFVTPAFPGYVSGHSAFSRSAAEVMTAVTGSSYFPGGLGSYTIRKLLNEAGPSQPVTLQWASYYDAADQVGLSRIWGGIHPPVDDTTGRIVGAQCGQGAWALATKYFEGSVLSNPITLSVRSLKGGATEIRFNTLRGLYYRLQSTADLSESFSDETGGAAVALDGWMVHTDAQAAPRKFYRSVSSLVP
jgi:hypothetical protein